MKLLFSLLVIILFTSCSTETNNKSDYFPIKRHMEWKFFGEYQPNKDKPMKYLGELNWKVISKEENTYTVEQAFNGIQIVSNGYSLDTLDFTPQPSYFLITVKDHGWIRIHVSFLNFGSDYIEVKNLFPDYYEETIKLTTKDGNITSNIDNEIFLKRNVGIVDWFAIANDYPGATWRFQLIDCYLP